MRTLWRGPLLTFLLVFALVFVSLGTALRPSAPPAPAAATIAHVTLDAAISPQAAAAAHAAHLAHLAHLARAGAAHATLTAAYTSPGNAALNWAERYALGHPYVYGGTGSYGFDCSGLVYASFGHATGIWLPRTTYGMLSSWHLNRTYSPQRGDLAFYGSGHVEFVTIWWHVTFGALDSGTLVGWHIYYPPYWQPTMFFRVT